MEVDAETPGTDNAAAETRRRNSLGLALDLRDLKSIILSNSFSDEKAAPHSRPYPSPVTPATTLLLRSNVSPATSSATSEADSYFDYQRPRQLSSATSVQTSNYGADDDDDDEEGRRKSERALPPSPELVPLSLPPIPDALPALPPAPAVAPAPSHPLHHAHRLSMTPVGSASSSQFDLTSIPEATTQPPRIRKNSIVDLPSVSVSSSGAAETGLQPLPPTPPRSPRAHLRMMPLPLPQTVDALPPLQLVSPATPAIQPLAAAAELIPQSIKVCNFFRSVPVCYTLPAVWDPMLISTRPSHPAAPTSLLMHASGHTLAPA